MKKAVLLLAGCALLAAPIGWYRWSVASPTSRANRFLAHLSSEKIDEAYALVTPRFRLLASKDELLEKSGRLGLDQYSAATWSGCSFPHPNTADLVGVATLNDCASIHLQMRLCKDESLWKVDFLGKTRGNLKVPSQDRLRKLVTTTMLDLGDSITAGDFSDFRGKCARTLQMTNTEQELQRSFAQIDYSFAQELPPQFTREPSINAQGEMSLSGHYDTSPSRMEFLMKFTHEEPDWRLTALRIHLVDIYESEAKRFVRLLASRQFKSAYGLTSFGFRQNANREHLEVVADQLQLADNATPKWTHQDSSQAVVTLDGNMPTRSGSNIQLRVGMVLEDGDWKVHFLR